MFVKEISFFLLSFPLFVDAIIGGEDVTKPHEYPWMVGIVTYEVENDQPTNFGACGGAIISENMILTAAHCVDDGWSETNDRGREYSKKTGMFVEIGHSSSSQRISVKVKSKLIHPNHGNFEKIYPLPTKDASESNSQAQEDNSLTPAQKQLAQSQYQALVR